MRHEHNPYAQGLKSPLKLCFNSTTSVLPQTMKERKRTGLALYRGLARIDQEGFEVKRDAAFQTKSCKRWQGEWRGWRKGPHTRTRKQRRFWRACDTLPSRKNHEASSPCRRGCRLWAGQDWVVGVWSRQVPGLHWSRTWAPDSCFKGRTKSRGQAVAQDNLGWDFFFFFLLHKVQLRYSSDMYRHFKNWSF